MKPQTRMTMSRIPIIPFLAAWALIFSASCQGGGGGGGPIFGPPGGGPPCTETTVVVNLRAAVTTMTMSDGQSVTMWGYAKDSQFGALDGAIEVPGPEISLQSCTENLVIHLDNNLPVPTSLVINGQTAEMTPVRSGDGRVRSFTHETPPGNPQPVDYLWYNLKPGTFLYTSGTHPSVQVQMGLYGAFSKDEEDGAAYADQPYDAEFIVLYSEVDPVIHQAVANNDFGAGKSVTSAVNYRPQYFLINGNPYTQLGTSVFANLANQRVLVRLLNAGLKTHAPMMIGSHATVIAEDGNPYNYPQRLYSLLLPAGKTKDVVVTPAPNSSISLFFDRTLHVSPSQ